ncbi:MAG: hypothetical protein M3Q69_05340, partial [Acidobacteriota bacterium]|nr:hypothetical protein [Acidobacteriota bacterium]
SNSLLSISLPLSTLLVRLTRDDRTAAGAVDVRIASASGDAVAWGRTDATGSLTVPYIAPGSYRVIASGREIGVVSVALDRAATFIAALP